MKVQEIKNTPFSSVELENGKFILVIGNVKVNEVEYESHKDVVAYVNRKSWYLMTNTMLILAKKVFELESKDYEKK